MEHGSSARIAVVAIAGLVALAAPATALGAFSSSSPWNTPAAQKGTIGSDNPYASLFTSYDPGLVLGGGPAARARTITTMPSRSTRQRPAIPAAPCGCATRTGRSGTSSTSASASRSRAESRRPAARTATWRWCPPTAPGRGRCGAASRAPTPALRAASPTCWPTATRSRTWPCGTGPVSASPTAAATPRAGVPARRCTRRS